MSAETIARLANMAVAEIGLPETFIPIPMAGYPDNIEWTDDSAEYRRAAYLATMKVSGPDVPVYCPRHTQFGVCSHVSVSDALRGRLCPEAESETAS